MTTWRQVAASTSDDLLACARGEMFGPGNAQLPAPPMLMFDRITEITADGGTHGKGYIERRARYRSATSGSSTATSSAIR